MSGGLPKAAKNLPALTPIESRKINQVLLTAMKSGSMDQAIAQYGKDIAPERVAVLKTLSPVEIRSLAQIKEKLAKIGAGVADNDTNIIY